jgi:hypothetical protein
VAKPQKSQATKRAGRHVQAKVPVAERRQAVLAATSRVKTKTPVRVDQVRRG